MPPLALLACSRLAAAGLRTNRSQHALRLLARAPAHSAADAAFASRDPFARRHVGPRSADVEAMMRLVGVSSLEELADRVVPADIRSHGPMPLPAAAGETEALDRLRTVMGQNRVVRSHLGLGYSGTLLPEVIRRCLLENPRWYTPYTPYCAEIAQGRLEMLLNFQTAVCDLTGLEMANASLLDEGTAAAEAMHVCHAVARDRRRAFVVARDVHPQTVEVLRTRARGQGIEVRVVDDAAAHAFDAGDECGVLVQYPGTDGRLQDFSGMAERARAAGVMVVAATDLLALAVLRPPGEWGADIAVGSAQRFGVPMGFGGPHAAFFAISEKHKRRVPGRVVGVSVDTEGRPALRLALQTREQHIRRDRASSNICTAQALLANIAAAYAIYHGPEGLRRIAGRVHAQARVLAAGARAMGLDVPHGDDYFDTVTVGGGLDAGRAVEAALARGANIRRDLEGEAAVIALDETTTEQHVNELLAALAEASGHTGPVPSAAALAAELGQACLEAPAAFRRESDFLAHPVFSSHHSETEMMRYLEHLCGKDLGLTDAMVPLGSCTMKLNAASEMAPLSWDTVGALHPFAPADQVQGYLALARSLERDLATVTGLHAVSLQPNAGSQGEFAGLTAIARYHESRGEGGRNVCLVPVSAHGTNPASATMCGMRVVPVACDERGNVDVADLRAKAEKHADRLAALMVTYPSTHGVFERDVREAVNAVHAHGGQVYLDGANMNAQVGLCSPGTIGADVCHLNLHKTFCIPHGGGGPGVGPIAVAEHLAPFLPGHTVHADPSRVGGAVASAPVGSASILPITWMYLQMMGPDGLRRASLLSILSANYMARRLEGDYDILYRSHDGLVAHEFIVDLRPIKARCGVDENDVAKRLVDFGFHPPTMSWPVVGTIMVEPTESESLAEMDRFCDAMLQIRREIREVEEGRASRTDNVVKRAPHTVEEVSSDSWDRPYTRAAAAYPLPGLRAKKFWPSVSRVDNVAGDRHLVCTCPPMSAYGSGEADGDGEDGAAPPLPRK